MGCCKPVLTHSLNVKSSFLKYTNSKFLFHCGAGEVSYDLMISAQLVEQVSKIFNSQPFTGIIGQNMPSSLALLDFAVIKLKLML